MTQSHRGTQQSSLPAGLSQPAQRALDGAGIHSLEQLSQISEAEIMRLHGIGPKSIRQLRAALQEKGLSFAGGK